MQVDEEAEEKGDFSAAAADFPVVPEMGAMGLIGWDDHEDGGGVGLDDSGLGDGGLGDGGLDDGGLGGGGGLVDPEIGSIVFFVTFPVAVNTCCKSQKLLPKVNVKSLY